MRVPSFGGSPGRFPPLETRCSPGPCIPRVGFRGFAHHPEVTAWQGPSEGNGKNVTSYTHVTHGLQYIYIYSKLKLLVSKNASCYNIYIYIHTGCQNQRVRSVIIPRYAGSGRTCMPIHFPDFRRPCWMHLKRIIF